jgi:hypothetical protein
VLRPVQILMENQEATEQACREAWTVQPAYARWRKEYGGLKSDQAEASVWTSSLPPVINHLNRPSVASERRGPRALCLPHGAVLRPGLAFQDQQAQGQVERRVW